MQKTIKEVRRALAENGVCDTIGKNKAGNFIARRGYFYHHGMTPESTESMAADVKTALPNAKIVNSGDHYAAFRGGASTAQGSHLWVEFTFPTDEQQEEAQMQAEAAERAAGWDARP